MKLPVLLRFAIILWLTILLAACGQFQATPEETQPADLYQPPTAPIPLTPIIAIQPTAQVPAVSLTPLPTATPACFDNLTYLEDLTFPDGTQVEPGEVIDKRWLVRNSGSCNWDETYSVRLISGPELGAGPLQALFPARSEAEATIRITFTAPSESGAYRSAWQAHTPAGVPFGDPIYLDIIVP